MIDEDKISESEPGSSGFQERKLINLNPFSSFPPPPNIFDLSRRFEALEKRVKELEIKVID
jgi:hypothetical protein